jgi:hypothetical protein
MAPTPELSTISTGCPAFVASQFLPNSSKVDLRSCSRIPDIKDMSSDPAAVIIAQGEHIDRINQFNEIMVTFQLDTIETTMNRTFSHTANSLAGSRPTTLLSKENLPSIIGFVIALIASL